MTASNRQPSGGAVFLSGVIAGAGSYVVAELLIPASVSSPGNHDLLLAARLGFIYGPFIGVWLGWLQRSWQRAVAGAVTGIAVGFVYMILCSSRNFLAIMVGFPALLGGLLAVVLAS